MSGGARSTCGRLMDGTGRPGQSAGGFSRLWAMFGPFQSLVPTEPTPHRRFGKGPRAYWTSRSEQTGPCLRGPGFPCLGRLRRPIARRASCALGLPRRLPARQLARSPVTCGRFYRGRGRAALLSLSSALARRGDRGASTIPHRSRRPTNAVLGNGGIPAVRSGLDESAGADRASRARAGRISGSQGGAWATGAFALQHGRACLGCGVWRCRSWSGRGNSLTLSGFEYLPRHVFEQRFGKMVGPMIALRFEVASLDEAARSLPRRNLAFRAAGASISIPAQGVLGCGVEFREATGG